MECKQYLLRELKEQGILTVVWIPGATNVADLFTKNLAGPDFRKHVRKLCGDDNYDEKSGEDD